MRTILLEVRDSGTCMPVMATTLTPGNEAQYRLLRRAGFDVSSPVPDVYLSPIEIGGGNYDPFSWRNGRTLNEAHRHIRANFSQLNDGDVIDVQFILGETAAPKTTEA